MISRTRLCRVLRYGPRGTSSSGQYGIHPKIKAAGIRDLRLKSNLQHS